MSEWKTEEAYDRQRKLLVSQYLLRMIRENLIDIGINGEFDDTIESIIEVDRGIQDGIVEEFSRSNPFIEEFIEETYSYDRADARARRMFFGSKVLDEQST